MYIIIYAKEARILGLSERKKKILKAVVEENLRAAEPVSSQKIVDEYLTDVSSATIRNELMALEEMGLLYHPHTSSGRLPTSEGLKRYVEELMPERRLSNRELAQIKDTFKSKINSLEDALKKTAKTISDATDYASIVYTGLSDEAIIESIQLFKVSGDLVLVIVMTDVGIIKDLTMRCTLNDNEIKNAGKVMTKIFAGKSLGEVTPDAFEINAEIAVYKSLFSEIIKLIIERNRDFEDKFEISGKEKLLNYPEYQDISKFKNALQVMDKKEALAPLLSSGGDVEISIKIGGDGELEDCSLVSAVYKINGKQVGSAGVIGPVRMDYAKAVSVLKGVAKTLEENMSDFVKGEGDERKR